MNSDLSFQSAKQKLQADWPLFVALAVYLAGVLALSHTGLFWDSVSIFAPATYFYENHWASLSLPSGYVTDNLMLNLVLSFWWAIFGRNLLVTHIFFALFGCGAIVEIYRLCHLVELPEKARRYVFMLAVSDTAVVTQLLIPMFDGIMLSFALWGIRAIVEDRRRGLMVAMLLLVMLRSRGILFCGALAACHWIYWCQFKKTLRCFLPAGLAAVGLLCLQWYLQRGIFGFGAGSPWRLTNLYGVFVNTMYFGRFMSENGRLFLWLAVVVAGGIGLRRKSNVFVKPNEQRPSLLGLCRGEKRCAKANVLIQPNEPCQVYLSMAVAQKRALKKNFKQRQSRALLVIFVGVWGLCFFMTVPFCNPYGPQYFLPFFVLLPCVAAVLIFKTVSFGKARWICLLLTIGLWSGHLWRYPESQPVSWCTTLRHLPYYELRSSMRNYMRERDIRPSEVKSFFPMVKSDDMIDLSGDKEKFVEEDGPVRYILYSNVFNLGGADKAGIGADWVLQRRFEKGGIHMDLYRTPEKQK